MSNFYFPKPRDREMLEDMISDLFSYELGNSNFQRYGRNGQSQDGVDVAGMVDGDVIGIQCKNHPDKIISTSEIDKEIKKSKKFKPSLSKLIIATSSLRDTKAHRHVLKINKERKRKELYPVEIIFWEEIQDLFGKYPDLTFKYFTKQLPAQKPEDVILPDIRKRNHKSFAYPQDKKSIIAGIEESLSVRIIDPYNAFVGISSFDGASFDGLVDLELQLGKLVHNDKKSGESVSEILSQLKDLKGFLDGKFFSKKLTLFIHARLSLAFLIGHIFKKVSKYDLVLVSGEQVWRTYDLPVIHSGILDCLPEVNPKGDKEAVVILNVNRDISLGVKEYVKTWKTKPYATLGYFVDGGKIKNAAHALAVATDMAQKMKNLKDKWGMKRIHFFGAIPAPLAVMISYHLNAMCPINIYFMDQETGKYELGCELTNNL